MAHPGQVLDNPISGERIVFHKTAAQTNGELLSLELRLAADGEVPGAHVHPSQEERFRVVSGTMKFRRGFRTIVARRGDTVTVPPRTAHRFENVGRKPAQVLVEVRPALRMEYLFETTAELAQDGRTNRKGLPKLFELALFMREFEQEVRAPFIPAALVRLVMAPVAWLARRRGISLRRPVVEEKIAALSRYPIPVIASRHSRSRVTGVGSGGPGYLVGRPSEGRHRLRPGQPGYGNRGFRSAHPRERLVVGRHEATEGTR
ncbi:MAG: cupin domain-containing protein [Streptosporangiaceae bacterium]